MGLLDKLRGHKKTKSTSETSKLFLKTHTLDRRRIVNPYQANTTCVPCAYLCTYRRTHSYLVHLKLNLLLH